MLGECNFLVGISTKNLLVVFYVVGLIRPHPREKSDVALGKIGLLGPCFVYHLVPPRSLAKEVGRRAVAIGLLAIQLAVETLSIKHGPVAVLLAVVVGQKRQSILGVVLVNGRVGVGANGQHHEARVANQNHHHSQNTLLHQRTIGLYRPANSEINPRNNSNCHEGRTRVFGQANAVDRRDFKEAKQAQNNGYDYRKNQSEHHHRRGVCHNPSPQGDFRVVFVEVNHHHRRNDQEHKNVNPNRKSG